MFIFLYFWNSFVFRKGKSRRKKLEGKTTACKNRATTHRASRTPPNATRGRKTVEMFDSCKRKYVDYRQSHYTLFKSHDVSVPHMGITGAGSPLVERASLGSRKSARQLLRIYSLDWMLCGMLLALLASLECGVACVKVLCQRGLTDLVQFPKDVLTLSGPGKGEKDTWAQELGTHSRMGLFGRWQDPEIKLKKQRPELSTELYTTWASCALF